MLGVVHLVRTQIFRKTEISYPRMRTRTWAYQGVWNISFSENFINVLNEWPPAVRFQLFTTGYR